MKEKEGQTALLNIEGDPSLGCDVNMDRVIATKKRDTLFVDARKKQIELYGNYYPAGISNEKLLEWCNNERDNLILLVGNIETLRDEVLRKIESDRQAKLSATLSGLSETEKEQLKAMLA